MLTLAYNFYSCCQSFAKKVNFLNHLYSYYLIILILKLTIFYLKVQFEVLSIFVNYSFFSKVNQFNFKEHQNQKYYLLVFTNFLYSSLIIQNNFLFQFMKKLIFDFISSYIYFNLQLFLIFLSVLVFQYLKVHHMVLHFLFLFLILQVTGKMYCQIIFYY